MLEQCELSPGQVTTRAISRATTILLVDSNNMLLSMVPFVLRCSVACDPWAQPSSSLIIKTKMLILKQASGGIDRSIYIPTLFSRVNAWRIWDINMTINKTSTTESNNLIASRVLDMHQNSSDCIAQQSDSASQLSSKRYKGDFDKTSSRFTKHLRNRRIFARGL